MIAKTVADMLRVGTSEGAEMAYKVPPDPHGRVLDCDLIMKGGVTSGLVFPGAITSLADKYRLRSIGGTSAGAIAAVAAAAMEYGLQTRTPADLEVYDPRFALANLPIQVLAQRTDQGSTRLEAMFSGDVGTAAMLDATKAALSGNFSGLSGLAGPLWRASRLRTALIQTGLVSAFEAVAGGAMAGWAVHLCPTSPAFDAAAIIAASVASFATAAWLNLVALRHQIPFTRAEADTLFQPIIDNGLGLSTGMTTPSHTIGGTPIPALTPWLHQTIQSLAGLPDGVPAAVLTFGKLWTLGTVAKPSTNDPRAIDLVLVCSDLNRLQSASFPFLPENERLFYDPREWAKLFPKPVVDAVGLNALDLDGIAKRAGLLGYTASEVRKAASAHGDLGDRLRLMPYGRDIPILIAARASMAFPGLFTPVPMWLLRWVGNPDQQTERTAILSRVYLADGGLTSNFPIHLFDAAVPSRPTFALNLLYPGDDLSVEEFVKPAAAPNQGASLPSPENVRTMRGTGHSVSAARYNDLIMPFANNDQVHFYKAPAAGGAIQQLLGLVVRVVETSRTWGDVSLFNQTGTRDRTIHIRLTGAEGGFNFNMSSQTIASIDKKGMKAGTVLAKRFLFAGASDPLQNDAVPALDWLNHRTVRINGFLGAQDLLADRFHGGWQALVPPIPQRDVPPSHTLAQGKHLQLLAHALDGHGSLPAPKPDPLEALPKPLNLLRMRPAESDPRASHRA